MFVIASLERYAHDIDSEIYQSELLKEGGNYMPAKKKAAKKKVAPKKKVAKKAKKAAPKKKVAKKAKR